MLNENKIDNVEFLGNWDDEADAFKQSAIPEYAITYDSELLKTTTDHGRFGRTSGLLQVAAFIWAATLTKHQCSCWVVLITLTT